jgi:hypothetical protein
MIVSSIQELLTDEHATRFGRTEKIRSRAMAAVIDTAFNNPTPSIREHAANHLRKRGIEIVYAKTAI